MALPSSLLVRLKVWQNVEVAASGVVEAAAWGSVSLQN